MLKRRVTRSTGSLACLLWRSSTADPCGSHTLTERDTTASRLRTGGQGDRVLPSALHLHPLLQFKLQPIPGTQILSSGVWVRHFWPVEVLTVRAMSLRCSAALASCCSSANRCQGPANRSRGEDVLALHLFIGLSGLDAAARTTTVTSERIQIHLVRAVSATAVASESPDHVI